MAGGSTPGTRGFRIRVVLLLDWLPTEAAEPSLPKNVWLFRSHFSFPLSSERSERGEIQNSEANVCRLNIGVPWNLICHVHTSTYHSMITSTQIIIV